MTLTLSLECRGRFLRLRLGGPWLSPWLGCCGSAAVVECGPVACSLFWRRMVWR